MSWVTLPSRRGRPTRKQTSGPNESLPNQRSGISVKQFCKEQGLTEYSFYAWRKRLQERGPVRFALVERSARRQERTTEPVLDLVLATGERLRIGTGVDITTLRTVLDVLRR